MRTPAKIPTPYSPGLLGLKDEQLLPGCPCEFQVQHVCHLVFGKGKQEQSKCMDAHVTLRPVPRGVVPLRLRTPASIRDSLDGSRLDTQYAVDLRCIIAFAHEAGPPLRIAFVH